jgi:hypothetical protein
VLLLILAIILRFINLTFFPTWHRAGLSVRAISHSVTFEAR